MNIFRSYVRLLFKDNLMQALQMLFQDTGTNCLLGLLLDVNLLVVQYVVLGLSIEAIMRRGLGLIMIMLYQAKTTPHYAVDVFASIQQSVGVDAVSPFTSHISTLEIFPFTWVSYDYLCICTQCVTKKVESKETLREWIV